MMFQRKKKEDDGLDIIENVKEPFSFANFFEDHIVTKWKKFKHLLEERGILFFLVSPFQYRNRLLAKITLVMIGVLIGIIPRTFSLIDETKERNASSEIATIVNTKFKTGKITTRPLASSQYEKQHVLAFVIEGETSDGIPSTTNKYDVELSQQRGVSDIESVMARYEIIPINNTSRLLVLYIDNTQQNDETGNYNLLIKVKGDEIDKYSARKMEIVLSNSQQTTSLFDKDGIHLPTLSNQILNTSSDPIKAAETKLADAMSGYALNEERLNAMGMSVETSSEKMTAYVKAHTQLPTLSDTLNSDDIEKMTYDKNFATNNPLDLKPALLYGGTRYTTETNKSDSDEQSTQDIKGYEELGTVASTTSNVLSALSSLNSARNNKYTQLVPLQKALNPLFSISDIKGSAVVQP